ncbi:YdfR family protein, partial [Escherichia coli]|nr:YdfR family protein [Escherichia coli]EFM1394632.1 YdfR family protein [Escherichia coli]EHN4436202.1 YdfR family protein [Escherichia coli]EHR6538287.1 YdfR family protein [Escherichia coli]ELP9388528.1 YdfR family protein [Escherichia coli]
MKKKYELVVKGINNYPDKITVTVALEIGGYPSLLLPDVAISLDRTEGATLEFYEAEAKKQAKQFFMDVAAGLCEGDGPLPEKRLCSEERYTIQINNAYNTIQSEKDDIESRIEKLENSVVELNKKLSVQIPSEGEKKRRDEQFAAF